MELDTPRHIIDVLTIGVVNTDGQKAIQVGLKDTTLTLKLNEAQARMIANELQDEEVRR